MTEETIEESLKRVWDELESYYDELNGTSDRAAAILAAAYFEVKLRNAIMCRFVQMSSAFSDQENGGFKGRDPISNFSAKIEIGFALGLYNEEIRENLHKVRVVRNKFAHASVPVEFNDDEIAKICCQLKPYFRPDPDTLRSKYITYLKEVEEHLQYPATNPKEPKTLRATAKDALVHLEWIPPSGMLTKLQVRWKEAADMPFDKANTWTDLAASAMNYTVAGLNNGTEYTFAVRAENATGPGEPAFRSATPQAALSP